MAQPATIFLIGGAALLGYLAVRKRPTPTSSTISAPTMPPFGPSMGPSSGGQYVGAAGYTWPSADKFPTQEAFQAWLRGKGYASSSSGNVRDGATVSAVSSFQRDFNIVRHWLMSQGWGSDVPELSVDGKIGQNTIAAMVAVDATVLPGVSAQSWPVLVTQAKTPTPQPTPTPTPGPGPAPSPQDSDWGDHTLCFAAEGSITDNHYPTPHQLGTMNKMLLATAISQRKPSIVLQLTEGRPEFTVGGHTHDVSLGKTDLQRLSRGQSVTVVTSTENSGLTDALGNPHSHAVSIFCQK